MSMIERDTKARWRYRFGSVEFDEVRFELRVAGSIVPVERKPLEVLALLLTHAGEVVTKEELLTQVWAGRPTVDTVITNALTKLRGALGEDNAAQIVTQPRVGYRLVGPIERMATRCVMTSSIELSKDNLVPLRPNFQLNSLLSASKKNEVWLAHHHKTGEQRVYKFAQDGEHLSSLKREVTLYRLLQKSLGTRSDMVRVFDWNFETAPFFIECEYGGEDLQTWSEDSATLQSFTLQQRIDLFIQIATVVAAAHDVGVLHKDLKPTNVLITSEGDIWRVRLTDFGSGRVLDPQRLADLGITQLGLTMTAMDRSDNSGTLFYLAPELLAQQAPTIQSDVYALGMMLYQLVVGNLHKPMTFGWEREITDELLRDDIRAATEGNPAHRLSSVYALIERLRTLDARHHRLQQEQQSQLIVDQARETLRVAQVRRPWMIAAGAAGILFLLGFAASSWLYVRATHVQHQLLQSQAQTLQQATRIEAINEFWNNDVLGVADPFTAGATQQRTIKDVMAAAANNINGRFTGDPLTEAAIRMKLGDIFSNMADGVAAESQWRRVLTVLTSTGDTTSPQLVQSHYGLAQALLLQSKFDQVAAELNNADRLRMQYAVSDPQTEAIAHRTWGNYFYTLQQPSSAIPHYEQALQLLHAQSSPDLHAIDYVRMYLGDAYVTVNQFRKAEQLLHDLVEDIKLRHNPSELMLAKAKMIYGQSLLFQHQYRAAEPLIEQSYQTILAQLGATNNLTISALTVRCELYSMTKRLEKSSQCTQRSYELTRANNGDQHIFTLIALVNVGISQYSLNRYVAAIQSFESARAVMIHTIGPNSPATQSTDFYLARCLLKLHQIDRAQVLVQPLDAKVLEEAEPGAPWALRIQLLRGMVLFNQGKRSEALPLLQAAAQLQDDADPTDTILQEARQSLHRMVAL